ncbi:MAG: hypothetical protein R3C61_21930 [Bacteroidia bacterium]
MKNLFTILLLVLFCVLFSGCPVGIDHPIGTPGKEKVDPALIGTWSTGQSEVEVSRLSISARDEYSYQVEVLERGTTYALETDNLTGWVTELDGKKFFYLKPDNEEKYYHYMIKIYETGTMVTCDVSLLDGGVDAVVSTQSFRDQVSRSMNMEEYCAETIEWIKE